MDIKDLVEEVGYAVKRKAACHGGEYSSACPFCKEGDDRFLIWPHRHNGNGNYNGGRYSCRVCGRYGDAITFLCEFHGLRYLAACDRLKINPKGRELKPVNKIHQRLQTAGEPPALWIEKATCFIDWCHSKLMSNLAVLPQIHKRGFTNESLKQYKIGFNPGDIRGYDFRRNRSDWGLEDQFKADGSIKGLWLPIGFTIPTFNAKKQVIKLKVRRSMWSEGDKLPKYVEISGSKACPSIYGNIRLPIVLVLESELDGLLVQQFASDLLYCVALGGSTKPLDAETDGLLRRTKNILFLPDFDKAGATAWAKWQKMFPGIRRILTPHEKSAGDYHVSGGNIREWLEGCILRLGSA